MMKIAIAIVAPLCLSFVACGGESSGNVPAPSSSATTAPTGSTAPAPSSSSSSSSSSGTTSTDHTPPPSDSSPPPAPTTTPPDPPPPGEPGICAPNAQCGGLTDCVDHCYGERCCELVCHCDTSIPSNLLECTLVCR